MGLVGKLGSLLEEKRILLLREVGPALAVILGLPRQRRDDHRDDRRDETAPGAGDSPGPWLGESLRGSHVHRPFAPCGTNR